MDSRYPRQDFSQLATLASPSSNVKRAESGSLLTSKPHKARGLTEVSNRNTISRDSTQNNELCALALRNRNTLSKDLTQSDGPFKSKMWNRGTTSKAKIENDKPRTTGAILPNDSPGLYAVQQPSPAQQQQIQQQQHLQQFYTNSSSAQMMAMRQLQGLQQQQQQAMFAQQFQNTGDSNRANELPMGMQLTPQQLHQLRQRNAAVGSGHVAADNSQAAVIYQQMTLSQYVAQQQAEHQRAAMGRT